MGNGIRAEILADLWEVVAQGSDLLSAGAEGHVVRGGDADREGGAVAAAG